MNKYGFLVNVYLLLIVAHLFLLQTDMVLYQEFTKALLMPVLMAYVWWNAGKGKWPIMLALLFGWMGDVLLIFSYKGELFFLLGLGAFLIGHVWYIKSFVIWKDGRGKHQWTSYAGLVVLVTMLMSRITAHLGDMLVPVLVYVAVITAMVLMAIRRKDGTNVTSYYTVLTGALLFVASDYMIAWNKFYLPISNSGLWIMLTYAMAQYLLVQGLLWHKKVPHVGGTK